MDDIAMISLLPYTVLNKFFFPMVCEGKKQEVRKWKIKFKKPFKTHYSQINILFCYRYQDQNNSIRSTRKRHIFKSQR